MIVQWIIDGSEIRSRCFEGLENVADLMERISRIEGTRFHHMYVNGFRVSPECEVACLDGVVVFVGNVAKEGFRFAIRPAEEFTDVEFEVDGLPNVCAMTISKSTLVGEFLQMVRNRYRNASLGKIVCDGVKLFATNRVYDCYSGSSKLQILEKKENVVVEGVSRKFEVFRFRFAIDSELLYKGVFMEMPVFMELTCEKVQEMVVSYLKLYHGIDDVKVDLYFGPGIPFMSGTLNQLLGNRILASSERVIYVVVYKSEIKVNLEHVFDNVVTLNETMALCLNPLRNPMYRSSMDCMTCAFGYLQCGGSKAADFIRNLIQLIPFPPMITSLHKMTREKPTVRDIFAIAMPICIVIEKCYHVCSDFYSHIFQLMSDVSKKCGVSGQVINLRIPELGSVYLCQGKYRPVGNSEEMLPDDAVGGIADAIADLSSNECKILCEGMIFPRPKLQFGERIFDPYE